MAAPDDRSQMTEFQAGDLGSEVLRRSSSSRIRTSVFQVGDLVQNLSVITVRRGESLDSEILEEDLESGTLMKVLELGVGRRLHIVTADGELSGWVSTETAKKKPLLEPAPAAPSGARAAPAAGGPLARPACMKGGPPSLWATLVTAWSASLGACWFWGWTQAPWAPFVVPPSFSGCGAEETCHCSCDQELRRTIDFQAALRCLLLAGLLVLGLATPTAGALGFFAGACRRCRRGSPERAAGPQILVRNENGPRGFDWHHRVLLFRASEDIWICLTPDHDLVRVKLLDTRHEVIDSAIMDDDNRGMGFDQKGVAVLDGEEFFVQKIAASSLPDFKREARADFGDLRTLGVDLSMLTSAELLVRWTKQTKIAVERNPRHPDYSGLDIVISAPVNAVVRATTSKPNTWVTDRLKDLEAASEASGHAINGMDAARRAEAYGARPTDFTEESPLAEVLDSRDHYGMEPKNLASFDFHRVKILRRDPDLRKRLRQRSSQQGLLTRRPLQKGHAGIFAVKKDGPQRLIMDAQAANRARRLPPPIRSGSSRCMADLDLSDPRLRASGFGGLSSGPPASPTGLKGDVGDCVYNFTVPELASRFGFEDRFDAEELESTGCLPATIWDDAKGVETTAVAHRVEKTLDDGQDHIMKEMQPAPTLRPGKCAAGAHVDNLHGHFLQRWLGHVANLNQLSPETTPASSACYRSIDEALEKPKRTRPSAKSEIRCAMNLLFLMEADLSAKYSDQEIREARRWRERWRYRDVPLIEGQACEGLGYVRADAPGLVAGPLTAFGKALARRKRAPGVPALADGWTDRRRRHLVSAERWRWQDEHIDLKEARAALTGLRRRCRSVKLLSSKLLTLSDSRVTVGAFEKGRSSAGLQAALPWAGSPSAPGFDPREFRHGLLRAASREPQAGGWALRNQVSERRPCDFQAADAILDGNPFAQFGQDDRPRRWLAHQDWQTAAAGEGRDSLVTATVSNATLQRYAAAVHEFEVYAESKKLDLQLLRLKTTGRVDLPKALASLKGWAKRSPGRMRLPLPDIIVDDTAVDLIEHDRPMMAAAASLQTDTYTRPSGVVELRQGQILPPAPAARLGAHFGIVIAPSEWYKVTKTGGQDSLLVGDAARPWLTNVLWILRQPKAADSQRLFTFSLSLLDREIKKAADRLGYSPLGVCPHVFRHPGASNDKAHGRRTLKEVQKRGRWASSASVARYEKSAVILQQLRKVTQEKKTRAEDPRLLRARAELDKARGAARQLESKAKSAQEISRRDSAELARARAQLHNATAQARAAAQHAASARRRAEALERGAREGWPWARAQPGVAALAGALGAAGVFGPDAFVSRYAKAAGVGAGSLLVSASLAFALAGAGGGSYAAAVAETAAGQAPWAASAALALLGLLGALRWLTGFECRLVRVDTLVVSSETGEVQATLGL
ncbi:unnamed protein product [Prorocentrum cordatum]|uniref:Tyr recombinase domain-containing protein n=1 Tax=Prorocentrum cordatum TaxID=2364126 RepID=A0ABN9V9J4_9DINO|nr:unnamed protein product [Polarella glacialis]